MNGHFNSGRFASGVAPSRALTRLVRTIFLCVFACVFVCGSAQAQREWLRSEMQANAPLVDAPQADADWNVLVLLNASYAKSQGVMVFKALDSVIKVPH